MLLSAPVADVGVFGTTADGPLWTGGEGVAVGTTPAADVWVLTFGLAGTSGRPVKVIAVGVTSARAPGRVSYGAISPEVVWTRAVRAVRLGQTREGDSPQF